ncbi:MAG: thrombospondin type 3 repeat-containing protein [Chloroflexota bacterium]|nr:thrombospondin type 3 repeat-containing protein [Chloroflexota bacterium]
MRTIDVIQGSSNRNQSLRFLMLIIIVGTFPFYCLGLIIIGSAPADNAQALASPTERSNATFTPLGGDQIAWTIASASPVRIPSITPLSILQPTPRQFIPPTAAPTDSFAPQTLVIASPTVVEASPTRPAAPDSPSDSDSDGLPDSADNCPGEFGYADNAGCPYPDDPDRDGIRAAADLCPNEFAPDSARGCRDFDDDGLDTSQDDCPEAAGPSSNRGCPLDDAVVGG